MSTMTHDRQSVKSANILALSSEERDDAPVAFSVGRSTPIDQRPLPTIDGSGLTEAEFSRVNGFGNRAKVAYAASLPNADEAEVSQVEKKARQDGLRTVLRDRPAAPPLPDAACCSPDEATPCVACVDGHADEPEVADELVERHRALKPAWFAAHDAAEKIRRERLSRKREIPAFRITDDCGDCHLEAAEGLTLEKVINDDVARLIASPKMFEAERVVWNMDGYVMAVIGMRSDGSPFVTMLDVTDEDDDPVTGTEDAETEADTTAVIANLERRVMGQDWVDAHEADTERWREQQAKRHSIPSFRIYNYCGEAYFDAGHDLTLDSVIERDIARLKAHPDLFDSERVIWNKNGEILAVMLWDAERMPYAVRFDKDPILGETPDPLTVADPAMTAEEPAPLLTLPELIDQEVARMRRFETGAHDLMMRALEELARVVRTVDAERPDQVDARLEILDRDYSADWRMPSELEPELTAGGRIV